MKMIITRMKRIWKWKWRWKNEPKNNENLNDKLDEIIDKSKSFEDQIESLKKEKI